VRGRLVDTETRRRVKWRKGDGEKRRQGERVKGYKIKEQMHQDWICARTKLEGKLQ